jgi:hypothetical protein
VRNIAPLATLLVLGACGGPVVVDDVVVLTDDPAPGDPAPKDPATDDATLDPGTGDARTDEDDPGAAEPAPEDEDGPVAAEPAPSEPAPSEPAPSEPAPVAPDDGAPDDGAPNDGAPDDEVCTADDPLPLPNAGLVEPPGVGGCPAGMAPIDAVGGAFCMDRWEAFVEALDAVGQATPWSPYASPGSAVVVARSAPGAVPQGTISGRQARDACANAGKRLCSDDEWLRACRGAAGTTYPYGAVRAPGVCNDARDRHPAVEYFGTSAAWIWSELDHPCLNQLRDGLAPTGSHPGCVNDVGLHFDLMGNLHEWTADPAGTFRGGFYVDTRINGDGCLYRTTAHDVGHFDYSTGFRCCRDLP